MVISSIVFGSVVVLAFVVLLVAKARTKLRRRKCDVTSSSSDETIPVESNTSSSKLTRSVPTGVAKFTKTKMRKSRVYHGNDMFA